MLKGGGLFKNNTLNLDGGEVSNQNIFIQSLIKSTAENNSLNISDDFKFSGEYMTGVDFHADGSIAKGMKIILTAGIFRNFKDMINFTP